MVDGLGNDIPMLSLYRTIEIDLKEIPGEEDIPLLLNRKALCWYSKYVVLCYCMEERFRLSNGFRWFRWIFAFIGFFALIGVLAWENLAYNMTGLIICTALFLLLNRSRRIFFDSRNIYIIRGKDEKEIPLRTIRSLKRSRAKVNSKRFWIITYEADGAQEKKFRFLPVTFDSNIKKLKEYLKQHNPDVVIWDHPFFNH